mgnify:CR=1 FL=1
MSSSKDGAIIVLSSPSGAGKTSLLQILGTLDKPDKTKDLQLHINGIEVSKLNDKECSRATAPPIEVFVTNDLENKMINIPSSSNLI